MPSYTDIFGGETINPSQLSYISYSISADLVLVWPLQAVPDDNVAADKIDILPSTAGLSVYLPPANQTSVGNDVLIRNTGADTFSVLDSAGGSLGSVASGEAWYFVLKTNATAAGAWYAIEFGVGTSSASAASLAGYGLRARTTLLDQNLLTVPLLANYAVTEADRASVLQNGSGAVAYTFASAATLGNGFFVYVINAGTGNLTLTPAGAETIDGSANKILAPSENAMIFSDGINLNSLGYGRSLVNTVSASSIAVGGTGTYTLDSAEVAAQVQDYTGTLTGARIVDYGSVVGYWFVWNSTSGAYSLTAQAGGLDTGVVITQGNFSILRSNGTNMEVAFSDAGGTVTSVATSSDMTGGPITTTGTLTLSNTGVAAGSYGAASETLTATVDAKGRLTALADTSIAIAIAQVTPFSSADLRGQLTDETGTGLAVFATAPTLSSPVVGTQAPLNASTLAASTAYVDAATIAAVPPGVVNAYAGAAAPTGWLLCDGTSYTTAAQAALFAAIGYAFGGAGANFNVPDLRGRVIAGVDGGAGRLGSGATGGITGAATLAATGGEQSHAQTATELAAHTHLVPGNVQAGNDITGGGSVVYAAGLVNNANSGSAGSGTAANVVQPTIVLNYIIKA